MTYQEFIQKYNGQGVDFDGYYGYQCMDLAEQYNKEVVEAPRFGGNAVDCWTSYPVSFYDKIPNTPANVPEKGDIMIWSTGVGQFGHIAIFDNGDINSFTSLDQNWPIGSTAHFQKHNYNNVLGWLHPKPKVVPQVIEQPTQNDTLSDDEKRALQVLKDSWVSFPKFQQLEAFSRDLVEKYTHPQVTASPPVVTTVYTNNEPMFNSSLAKLLYQWAKSLG